MTATATWAKLAQLDDPFDAASYRRLLGAYASDPMGRGAPLSHELLERVSHDLAQHPTARVFLAGSGEAATGFATCFVGYSTFRARPLLNVHDIAVLPQWRRRGIGRALLAAIGVEAQALGCRKPDLEVRTDNPAALALYRAEGFGAAELEGGSVQYLFFEKAL